MLTYLDEATIRNAIDKRLSDPGKTDVVDVDVENFPDAKPPYMKVSVWCLFKDRINHDGLVDARSYFELPESFHHSHLLNEIDQIAEQHKDVRRKTRISSIFFRLGMPQKREIVVGTGLRGMWPQ